MGQNECLNIIEKENEWITSNEIAKRLNQQVALVCTSLFKLFKYKEVQRRNSKSGRLGYEYKKL